MCHAKPVALIIRANHSCVLSFPLRAGVPRTLPEATTSYGETFTSPTFTLGTVHIVFRIWDDQLELADIIWTPTLPRLSDASGLSRSSAICQSPGTRCRAMSTHSLAILKNMRSDDAAANT